MKMVKPICFRLLSKVAIKTSTRTTILVVISSKVVPMLITLFSKVAMITIAVQRKVGKILVDMAIKNKNCKKMFSFLCSIWGFFFATQFDIIYLKTVCKKK
jgi:murein endopeptidase